MPNAENSYSRVEQRQTGTHRGGDSILSSSTPFTDHLGTTPLNTGFNVGNEVGGYEILEVLGSGGMGLVLKARNVITGRVEAMKVILPRQESDPDLVSRFRREIQIQSTLYHPNIVAMHTAVQYGKHILMFLEYVDGVTLQDLLRGGPISPTDCVEYTLQLLDALSCIHARGIIHRDIKPGNVMVTTQNTIKLMDFGIARLADSSSLTQTGVVVGSLHYLSPEQRNGYSDVDSRADLFAVGILLYETLAGHPPIPALGQNLARLIESDPHVPMVMREIIMQSIADDPANRFQSAEAFRSELATLKSSFGTSSPVPGSAFKIAGIGEGPRRLLPPTAMFSLNSQHHLRPVLKAGLAVAVVLTIALVIALCEMGQKNLKNVHTQTRVSSRPSSDPRQGSPSAAAPLGQSEPLAFAVVGVPKVPGPELKSLVSDRPQRASRKFVVPEVRIRAPAPVVSTFDPPTLNSVPVVDTLSNIGLNDPFKSPPTPVILHAKHIHSKLRSAEGLLTVYGRDYRFQESNSTHAFTGLTADLLSSCRPHKASCTIEVIDSGHKEVIKLTPTPDLWNTYPNPAERSDAQ